MRKFIVALFLLACGPAVAQVLPQPLVRTQPSNDVSTKAANTAFVASVLASRVAKAGDTLTGTLAGPLFKGPTQSGACASTDGSYFGDGSLTWLIGCNGVFAGANADVITYPGRGTVSHAAATTGQNIPDYPATENNWYSQFLVQCKRTRPNKAENCLTVNQDVSSGWRAYLAPNGQLQDTPAVGITWFQLVHGNAGGTWALNSDQRRMVDAKPSLYVAWEQDMTDYAVNCGQYSADTTGCFSAGIWQDYFTYYPVGTSILINTNNPVMNLHAQINVSGGVGTVNTHTETIVGTSTSNTGQCFNVNNAVETPYQRTGCFTTDTTAVYINGTSDLRHVYLRTATVASAASATQFTVAAGQGPNLPVGVKVHVIGFGQATVTAQSGDTITVGSGLTGTPAAGVRVDNQDQVVFFGQDGIPADGLYGINWQNHMINDGINLQERPGETMLSASNDFVSNTSAKWFMHAVGHHLFGIDLSQDTTKRALMLGGNQSVCYLAGEQACFKWDVSAGVFSFSNVADGTRVWWLKSDGGITGLGGFQARGSINNAAFDASLSAVAAVNMKNGQVMQWPGLDQYYLAGSGWALRRKSDGVTLLRVDDNGNVIAKGTFTTGTP